MAETRRLEIGIISLQSKELIEKYLVKLIETSLTNITFKQLDYSNANNFNHQEHWDGVILVHPCSEGRLSLTDVPDSRYSELIPKLGEKYGSQGVLIICYLVDKVQKNTQETRLKTVTKKQPRAANNSKKIILCKELEDMFPEDVIEVRAFIENLWRQRFQYESPKKFPVTEGKPIQKQILLKHAEVSECKKLDTDRKDSSDRRKQDMPIPDPEAVSRGNQPYAETVEKQNVVTPQPTKAQRENHEEKGACPEREGKKIEYKKDMLEPKSRNGKDNAREKDMPMPSQGARSRGKQQNVKTEGNQNVVTPQPKKPQSENIEEEGTHRDKEEIEIEKEMLHLKRRQLKIDEEKLQLRLRRSVPIPGRGPRSRGNQPDKQNVVTPQPTKPQSETYGEKGARLEREEIDIEQKMLVLKRSQLDLDEEKLQLRWVSMNTIQKNLIK